MARERQWYEDVMDVALRATLKELGFKRKSHATYIREQSPDRLWAFELQLSRPQLDYFSEVAGVFVPAIEEAFERFAPNFAYRTGMRTRTHARTNIVHMVRLEKGWDTKAWYANPKSTTWLGGYRRSPKVDTVIRHCSQISGFNYNAVGNVLKVQDAERRRRLAVITQELGHDLDAWWRKYVLPWLHRCDDPLFLAEWMDEDRRADELVCAIAYWLAGKSGRARDFLVRTIQRGDTSYEEVFEEARERYGYNRGFWERFWRGAPRDDPDSSAKIWYDWRKKEAQAARSLADGLGIKL